MEARRSVDRIGAWVVFFFGGGAATSLQVGSPYESFASPGRTHGHTDDGPADLGTYGKKKTKVIPSASAGQASHPFRGAVSGDFDSSDDDSAIDSFGRGVVPPWRRGGGRSGHGDDLAGSAINEGNMGVGKSDFW